MSKNTENKNSSGVPERLLKPYDSKETEGRVYKLWEESGYFNPDNLPPRHKTPYSIVLPPPNVTGTLHLGHAAMLAIEDIMIRFERMRGKKTLWLPGTDHAAIATQEKVEKDIYKKEGKTRHDLGRDEFLKRVEAFAQESRNTITSQLRRMGSSVDWSREAYTLDEPRNLAVKTAFEQMYGDGLIYRGHRIVNWDPEMQTNVSDIEIEWREEKVPFYYLQYGPFVISTARPETKFGDKYIVMHPDDKRYKKYKHGQKIELEWINGPVTATIIKDKAVDKEFGTGVMTITPWHDATDFEIAKRHNLDKEQIIDYRGKLLAIAGEFAGQHIKKARPLIVEKLKEKGLLVKTDDSYTHNIAANSRGGGVIEPQIMMQWFVDVNKELKLPHSELEGIKKGEIVTLKKLMQHVVETGQIEIIPDNFKKIYSHWINGLRDWCVSRQIWYGHRIPVWYCLSCNTPATGANIKSKWFIVRHGETESNKARITQGHNDSPLTAEGRIQVSSAAEQLKNQDIGLIISSDLGRAKETAEIIAEKTGANIVLDKELREQYKGDAENMGYDEITEKFGTLKSYDGRPANIESYKEVEERIWESFAKHKESHGHKNVVIVSHGGTIRMLVKRIRNLSPEEALARKVIENAELISLDVLEKPCMKCGGDLFEQDLDTLDTWFSSGLWTFSTLGWPEKTKDFETYHPTDILETGYDILFFWVARMILMSTYLTGQIPFKKVYLHGLVRDGKGQKMSKSLGNIIDPVDMVDKYGADAVRLALIIGTAPGNDSKLSENKIRGYKHFANKIWNAARFVVSNLEDFNTEAPVQLNEKDSDELKNFNLFRSRITGYLENYKFYLAGEELYHYFWHSFADKTIEEHKEILYGEKSSARASAQKLLHTLLIEQLKLLHPFMPFVTEELWSMLPMENKKLLMIEEWPK